METINRNYLYEVVSHFYNAILDARENGDFSTKDVMHLFPRGCCQFASDLLAHYLFEKYNIKTIHLNGLYNDGNPENISNHEWLICGNLIIDITYSQFQFATGSKEEIYVGISNCFFNMLTDVHIVPDYDIRQDSVLYNDYKKICKYISTSDSL